MNYFFAEMNNSTVKMIDEFNRELADMSGNKIEVLKYGAIEGFDTTVAKSISSNISRSKSASFQGGFTHSINKYKVAPITWSERSFKLYKATQFNPIKPKSTGEVREKVNFERADLRVMIASEPFDKGSIRFAFVIDPSSGAKRKYVLKSQ